MTLLALFRTGLEGPVSDSKDEAKRSRTRFLPDNILDAIRLFKASKWSMDLLGERVHEKFAEIKMTAAERCPKSLGSIIKPGEVQFHHEVTNQFLWNMF
jgi:glutamine synthetase